MDREEAEHKMELIGMAKHIFSIRPSDIWSLNDLLRYALELIISGDDECVPAGVSDHSDIKQSMLDEINNAIAAEQSKKKRLPPMPVIAQNLTCLGLFLQDEELEKLEKVLNGEYRGKPGIKNDALQTKKDDIERTCIYFRDKSPRNYDNNISKLARKEKIDIRSVQRAIKRGVKYIREDIENEVKEAVSNKIDTFKPLRIEIIKIEMATLLDPKDKTSREQAESFRSAKKEFPFSTDT